MTAVTNSWTQIFELMKTPHTSQSRLCYGISDASTLDGGGGGGGVLPTGLRHHLCLHMSWHKICTKPSATSLPTLHWLKNTIVAQTWYYAIYILHYSHSKINAREGLGGQQPVGFVVNCEFVFSQCWRSMIWEKFGRLITRPKRVAILLNVYHRHWDVVWSNIRRPSIYHNSDKWWT